ncbi:Hypp1990 [Branchiostoma lanceolatum]|uniref:Hypp1990 protein n=1 Tax=Branchiostoma lanceolatum TaxID=7740 RepID=A0A8J9ZMT3_BRALA|nr:Hypp1990 [Branchiostoma lanceolatum]
MTSHSIEISKLCLEQQSSRHHIALVGQDKTPNKMWDKLISIFTCCLSINKVAPGEETTGDAHEDESMVKETTAPSIPVSSPPAPRMCQPRPEWSSDDILSQLRDEGVLPGLKRRDNAIAFHVPVENSGTPPRYHMRLQKIEKRMEERREKVKKPCPESPDDLKRQLSNAEVRRQELLAKKSARISTKSAEKAAKIKAKKASRKVTSSGFIVTSTSDSDVIATRESQRTKRMEGRLKKRRARVAKVATADALEKRQNLAAERRQDHVVATVSKAKKLGRPHPSAQEESGSAGR